MISRHVMSGSFFHPQPPSLLIFHLNLGGRSESLLRKPGFPYEGSESPGNCSGSSFCPDQVLLSKNFHPRPGCRRKSLLRNSGVGGGGPNSILIMYSRLLTREEKQTQPCRGSLKLHQIFWKPEIPNMHRASQNYYRQSCYPAKSKRGREEGDGTENVINCRDVCRKLSWHFMTTYDDFMTIYDVLCQWNKETEIVIKCRKLSWHVVNCRDVCRKLSWHFFSRPLPAVPFWISPSYSWQFISPKLPLPLPSWNSDKFI